MKENKYKRRTSTEFKQQTTKFQDEKGTGMGGGRTGWILSSHRVPNELINVF